MGNDKKNEKILVNLCEAFIFGIFLINLHEFCDSSPRITSDLSNVF